MGAEPLVVDVREDLKQGREPFGKIMEAVASLTEGQSLLLYATFEPVPLFRVLEKKGFAHEARQVGTGDWEVRFYRP